MNSLIDRIAIELHLDKAYVQSIIQRSSWHYKDYTIPKRNGGLRHIEQASPELKAFQYWVLKNILHIFPISQAAFAYKKGDSVKRHASYHKTANYIFHTDIRDFFPTIKSTMFNRLLYFYKEEFQERELWFDDICDVISLICFRRDHLSIGTVSSPAISNIVMYNFDESIRTYCENQGYRYSRYADDIYISSEEYIPFELKNHIKSELRYNGFLINSDKTWFKSRKGRRKITGLILTSDNYISLGSDMRNRIKKMIYTRIIKGNGDPKVILGYLAYLKDVEPTTYNRLITKYATYCDGDVISAIRLGPYQIGV